MIQPFLEALAIPDQCVLNKPIFKKLFYENAELDLTSKKILKEDIDKIKWLYTLKPSTININAYRDTEREYDEIAYLQIDLSNTARLQKIATFVNKAIPYPMVILFSFNDSLSIAIADKRINQSDKSKWVIEDMWITDWFNPNMPNEFQAQFMRDITVKNLSFVNFYALYTDIKNRVIALNSATRSGKYQLVSTQKTETRRLNMIRIAELEKDIAELRSTLNKETQFNKKLDFNVSVKKCQEAIKKLEYEL